MNEIEKRESKSRKILQIIALIVVMLFGIFMISFDSVKAAVVESSSKGEVFSNDRPRYNWDNMVVNVFSDEGYPITLWCVEKGAEISRYMTAHQNLYDAYEAKATQVGMDASISWATSPKGDEYMADSSTLYYKYRGVYTDKGFLRANPFITYWNQFYAEMVAANDPTAGSPGVAPGPFDEEADVAKAEATLPGLSKPTVYSIEYNAGATYSIEENQNALFVMTAPFVYEDGVIPLQPESLSSAEKANGHFTVQEKQYALWEMGINIGNMLDTSSDRGLGDVANKYQTFYETIHDGSGEDKYEDIVEAYNYEKGGALSQEHIEETTEEIDGEEYRTFVYKDTLVEQDDNADCYVLGPYYIDYTVDDEAIDVYYTTDGYEIKYNAIENITVYNQDKINIEELGGSFKIAYSYDGSVTEENEGKVTHIHDTTYYELADGEEIKGFDSRKEFYIIVYRGSMEPEDFTGFYAKIDFQYLEHVTGTMTEYEGTVYSYYYTAETTSKAYNQNFNGWYWYMREDSYTDDEGETHTTYTPVRVDVQRTLFWDATAYYLHRDQTSYETQKMMGYSNDGERHYKTYSIILTSDWTPPGKPGIEIYKKCATDGELLYGARFDVTLNFVGVDIYENEIVIDSMKFTKVTNIFGFTRISTYDIKQKGVYLGYFTGVVNVTIKETAAPANHAITQETSTLTLVIDKGVITGVAGSGESSLDSGRNTAAITIYDNKGGTPKIQIAKVDENNNLIEEAYFEIHVAYTDPEGVVYNADGSVRNYGELIDNKANIIRGQTKGGVLDLTVEDFQNMDNGFDITNYTGKITLNIVEISVDGAFSMTSESKDITLEYVSGILQEYTEYTDSEVVVQYLYDSVRDNIYKFATGEIEFSDLNGYIQTFLQDWITEQMQNTELDYNDVLAWLADYIEQNDEDIMRTVTTLTTEVLESADRSGDIVQITVEDFTGDIPDIPDKPEPEPEPLLMTIAGTVFLDQTTTKENENESNGLLDEGEELLYGVEVTLYKADGTLAELVQKEGEIRTNPTMTDENGYYEFMGVDPFEEYYVEFRYNGIEYTTTVSSEAEYNSDEWALTSKGSELSGDRTALNNQYKEIGSTTKAFDYYTIQSIYKEIADRTHAYINSNGSYPSMDSIYSEVIANHPDDDEIENKIEYIKSSYITAYAGYSSKEGGISSETSNGLYPYYAGERFMIDENTMNSESEDIEFAGDTLKTVYPGQLQVHLGLVERDSTDLSLITDIVDTRVSMNGYDTVYDMYTGATGYHQYIYEEDYNYCKEENTDGVAYYTDDQVEFYMTYETTITNATLTDTALVEMADYYNNKFSWASSYTTSQGNVIAGYSVTLNGTDITGSVTISDSSRYGITAQDSANTSYTNASGDQYKELFVRFNTGYMITDGDVLKIRLTFKMDQASANLYNKLYTDKENADYSRTWEIGNYAEINGYMTRDGYLDADSRPGNFSIEEFETLKAEYQSAYSNFVNNRTDDNARMLKLALGRLTDVREDDAWYVSLTLTNSGYVREIHGSVWEAITDEVHTATDLQNYEGLLTYIQENGLADLRVELVEICDDGTQIVRGKHTTGENGDYQFTSYIPGDYVVRFIYGEEDKDVRGKTTNTVGETLQVNGQYYQSTKANDQTDVTKYWYDTDEETRYSDAYDDAKSRVEQINAVIENTEEPSTSSDYEYDGVLEVESYRHKDVIYAYTSTMNLEVEYVRPELEGDRENTFYEYKVMNVDLGLTPRAFADLNIDKYVSNIKIYLQDGSLQLDANIDKEGNVTYLNDDMYTNIVIPNSDSATYLDGLIETLFDEQLLNGATLEITYTFTVSNDGEYDTIKYIYSEGREEPVEVIYYGEDYTVIPQTEQDRGEGIILYHAGNGENYTLEQYRTGNDERIEIRTAATNIVDYIDPALNFTQTNKAGQEINRDWELTQLDDFNAYREFNTELMSKYNTYIRGTDDNALYTRLLPGETATTTLTLSKVLATTSTETNNYEYSNLVEVTKIHSDSGKVIDIEGYDVNGTIDPETSENKWIPDIVDPYYPTLATSKSETIVIHAPTGMNIIQNYTSNLIIVLVVLVILAVGIVLIKKFVLKPKTE